MVVTTLVCTTALAFDLPFFGVHRGGAAWQPEHTLDTYREVLARWPGALLECDARLTKDGVVVLHHDATVDRTTDGTGPIAAMTLDEVKALDAGYRFTADGGATFPYRGKGLTIATLDELLTEFPSAPILIEPKNQPGIVDAVAAVVRKHHAEHRVLIASFQPDTMDAIKTALPNVRTCFSMTTGMRLLGAVRGNDWDMYTPEDHVLALSREMLLRVQLTPDELAKIQAKGVAVQLYDVDDETAMNSALDLGVDAVLTDRPDVLAAVLESHSTRSPNN